MKRNTLLLFPFLLAAVAAADPRWWRDPANQKELGLASEQIEEIERLHERDRDRVVDLRAEVEKKRMALEDVFDSATFDEGKAAMAHEALMRAEMEIRKLDHARHIAMRKVLGHEQFRKMRMTMGGPPHPPRPPHAPMAPMAPRAPMPPQPPEAPVPPAPAAP